MTTEGHQATGGQCWYCQVDTGVLCECGRPYCVQHGYDGHCMLCALGLGLYEAKYEPEQISGLIQLSLRAASGDPYITVPVTLQRARPLTLASVEKVCAALIQMLGSRDDDMRRRAAGALASTTISWPTLDPSPLAKHEHGISLMAADQVRRWLIHTLKTSRALKYEAVALAVLDKWQTSDFRDLYPSIEENLGSFKFTPIGGRVREVFDFLGEFYPTHSALVNERCEIITYVHYADRKRGVGAILERTYGPLMRYAPVLRKMLKKGTWLSSTERFDDWYYGEEEPL